MLGALGRRSDLWTLDSPRIWYERQPFRTERGISAYRRYVVSGIFIEDVGVGIVVDAGTAFFTTEPVSYYFDPAVPPAERERRACEFQALTGRQAGQKGTLVYDTGRRRVKCYCEQVPVGITCSTTGRIRVKNKTYSSLAEYYRSVYPDLADQDHAPAARVSFPGLDRPQWAAADRLWARVMNDDVPDTLKSIDKLPPATRRTLLEAFWTRLESQQFGRLRVGLAPGFWRPAESRVKRFLPGPLEFGRGFRLGPPNEASAPAYRKHYRLRLKCLRAHGCHSLPPALGRTVHCVYPKSTENQAGPQLAGDAAKTLDALTGLRFEVVLVEYETLGAALEQLRRVDQPGMLLLVLDDEPAAYYEAAFQLSDWRLKRVTQDTLRRHHNGLLRGSWDPKQKAVSRDRGRERWEQFVQMTALDVLQQMDVVPWRIDRAGSYEAELVIDVGHDRRHVALSLLVARPAGRSPSFSIVSRVQAKPDPKHETINPRLLADHVVSLFDAAFRYQCDALSSLLVLRDGRVLGQEAEAIEAALRSLAARAILSPTARLDIVDCHKDTLKPVRLWEVDATGRVENPLEGTALQLTNNTVVLTTTGQATLHQGTAHPLLLIGNSRGDCIMDAAEATFASAQLNWSNPRVAQRLPLPLKRTDDELVARAAQEIRRIR